MKTRPYCDDDDPALMELEWQSPRGEPTPFVHFRKRFVDRAALFSSYCLLVMEEHSEIVACVAAAIKETSVGGEQLRLAYLFDVRVAPAMRRRGLAAQLLENVEDVLKQQYGCDGAYAHIVATNRSSNRLFERAGFAPARELMLLTFDAQPADSAVPGMEPAQDAPEVEANNLHRQRDLWVEDVRASLQPFGLRRWHSAESGASLEMYDQSQVFFQIPAGSAPPRNGVPTTGGRHGRLFHPVGGESALEALLGYIRAGTDGYTRFSLMLDSNEPLAARFAPLATAARPYVVVTKGYHGAWSGSLNGLLYCDPREL